MANNDILIYSHNGRASDNLKVQSVKKGVIYPPCLRNAIESLGHFQNDVPDKAVTYDHVCHVVSEKVMTLDVSPEAHFRAFAKQLICCLYCCRALGFLRTDIEQSYFRLFYAKNIFGIYRTQDTILQKDIGFAIRIDASFFRRGWVSGPQVQV